MTGEQRTAFLEAPRGPSISPADPNVRQLASDYHAGKLSLDELRIQEVQEVTVATADTGCFVATDLARSRQAAEARAEEQLVARNTGKRQAMQRARDEALEHAATVLGSAEL
jgi:hypothetical protein